MSATHDIDDAASIAIKTDGSRHEVASNGASLASVGQAFQVSSDRLRHGPVLRVVFGLDGNSETFCKSGWGVPELGHRWSHAPHSELTFPDLPDRSNYALLFTGIPFGGQQRVVLSANGVRLAEASVSEMCSFGMVVPAWVMAAGTSLTIALDQPDGRSGRTVLNVPDDQLLGFAITHLTITNLDEPGAVSDHSPPSTALSVKDLMLNFESLGDNCEFGIVQRRCGAEPLGLFRFAAAPLQQVIGGIEHGFSDIGEPDLLALRLSDVPVGPREYLFHQKKYDILYHTNMFEGKMTVEKLFQRERNKLLFLRSKFVEDLREANKMFVVKSNLAMPEGRIAELSKALRQHGPNTLLWVVPADASHAGGSVIRREDGLLQGFIDRFAEYDNATAVSIECWVRLCRNALRARALG